MSAAQEALRILREARAAGEAELAALRALPPSEAEAVCTHIRRYVLSRYLLTEEEAAGLDFDALTARSIAKSAGISPETLAELEATQDCTGSTTAMAKKVLLLRSIERGLSITLPAMESAGIKTLRQLGELVQRTLRAQREGQTDVL